MYTTFLRCTISVSAVSFKIVLCILFYTCSLVLTNFLFSQIYETELILANTKLLLVESHCTEQKLIHELNYLKNIVAEQKEIIESSNNSIIKKFWNLRDNKPAAVLVDQKNDQTSKLEMRHSFCQSDNQDKGLPPPFHHSLSQDWV